MDNEPLKDWSLKSLLILNAAALLGLVAVGWNLGCFDKRPERKPDPEMVARSEELERKLKDPRVSACFHAAYAMGQEWRQEGKRKPSDAELHAIGTQACDHFKVPKDMRGLAVDKFKSGFGWGWRSTK
jgi:hypothetical protein